MNRASPVQLRKAIAMAHDLVKVGVLFVPMPVSSSEEFLVMAKESHERLEAMVRAAAAEETGGAA